MRLDFRKKTDPKTIARLKKRVRVRKKISGTPEKPRLCVYRSRKHFYVQLVDDTSGATVAAVSTLKDENAKMNLETAKIVGRAIAEKALAKKIETVVFDRSGYRFHGRIKALADAAREAGLKF